MCAGQATHTPTSQGKSFLRASMLIWGGYANLPLVKCGFACSSVAAISLPHPIKLAPNAENNPKPQRCAHPSLYLVWSFSSRMRKNTRRQGRLARAASRALLGNLAPASSTLVQCLSEIELPSRSCACLCFKTVPACPSDTLPRRE